MQFHWTVTWKPCSGLNSWLSFAFKRYCHQIAARSIFSSNWNFSLVYWFPSEYCKTFVLMYWKLINAQLNQVIMVGSCWEFVLQRPCKPYHVLVTLLKILMLLKLIIAQLVNVILHQIPLIILRNNSSVGLSDVFKNV